jgi:hypothetical protein
MNPSTASAPIAPPPLRTVSATRYVTPLREGGSLPAIVEADDDGMYVLKFRGAGQGAKALIAELVAGELGRVAGLLVPEIVLIDLDPELARTEPDPEIQDLIRASAGVNLGLDYLPGSVAYDPLAQHPSGDLASSIVWHDAFVTNVDRTIRNTNLLVWHRRTWLIDHGAALYFHHNWNAYLANAAQRSRDPFAQIRDHVLLPLADDLPGADERMTRAITPAVIDRIVALIPDEWLAPEPPLDSTAALRAGYRDYLVQRLEAPRAFVDEAIRARSVHV